RSVAARSTRDSDERSACEERVVRTLTEDVKSSRPEPQEQRPESTLRAGGLSDPRAGDLTFVESQAQQRGQGLAGKSDLVREVQVAFVRCGDPIHVRNVDQRDPVLAERTGH